MNEEKTVVETQEEIDELETAAMETAEEENAEELPESDDATENGAAEEGQEEGGEEEIDQPEEKDEFQHGENVRQPDNPEAIVEGLLYIVGEDGVKIEQLAIAIDKGFVEAYVALSQTQDMMGDTPQAVTTMLRAMDYTEHRDRVYRTVGNLYARDNNFDTAMVYYRKAIDENPADAEAFAASAMCYLHTGDLPSALASIRKALGLEDALAEQRKDEGNAEVYFAAALVHDAAGHSVFSTPFTGQSITIDTRGLAAGTYFLTLATPEATATRKLVVEGR